jgi:hypothetical protein
MKKAVWLSFDLGVRGDYESLYAWLADHDAQECGDSLAFFHYEYKNDLQGELKTALESAIEIERGTRIYAVYQSDTGKMKGTFLVGKRKQAPWTGYGASEEETSDES